jgi:hypothetical protein
MKRILISALAPAAALAWLLASVQPLAAQDLAKQIVGVWKYTSVISTEVATGVVTRPLGEKITGYIIYTAGGRVVFAATAENRKVPAAAPAIDAELAALFRTLISGSGTYKLEGTNMAVTYDSSSLPAWTGTTRKRKIEIVGNKLTITSAPEVNRRTGSEIVGTTILERVE